MQSALRGLRRAWGRVGWAAQATETPLDLEAGGAGDEALPEQPSPTNLGGETLAEQPSPSDEAAPTGAVLIPNEMDVFLHVQLSGPTAKVAPGGMAQALSPTPHGARTSVLPGNRP